MTYPELEPLVVQSALPVRVAELATADGHVVASSASAQPTPLSITPTRFGTGPQGARSVFAANGASRCHASNELVGLRTIVKGPPVGVVARRRERMLPSLHQAKALAWTHANLRGDLTPCREVLR